MAVLLLFNICRAGRKTERRGRIWPRDINNRAIFQLPSGMLGLCAVYKCPRHFRHLGLRVLRRSTRCNGYGLFVKIGRLEPASGRVMVKPGDGEAWGSASGRPEAGRPALGDM